MIYYVALDNPSPSGGVKTAYRHVEILCAAGMPAAMLHQKAPFTSATWFKSAAPVRYVPSTPFGRSDEGLGDAPAHILVWPEILRSSIRPMAGVRHVIFNQNVHYVWRGEYGTDRLGDYTRGAVASMVLTEYEKDFLAWAVPGHPVTVVRHGIDSEMFAYDRRLKQKQIAFMPRKHADEAESVFGWLAATGALIGWTPVAIDQMTEEDTAEILKTSQVFFAFGYPEGGTIPPFEALAAGCMVIGYGGFASDQDLVRCGGILIPSGDTCTFAQKAAKWLPRAHETPSAGLSQGVLDYFSLAQERESLLRFFKELGSG